MKKNSNTILIVIVVALIMSNLFFGYMLLKPKSRPGFGQGFQNMQLTDAQIQNVTSFFANTTDISKIKDYCNTSRMECFYYCRQINPQHEICSQLMQGRPNSQQTQKLN